MKRVDTASQDISKAVKDSTFVSRLNSSISEVEKYGRETYYMKRNDEDIFIITRDDEKTEN